jgi:hypothetical protein
MSTSRRTFIKTSAAMGGAVGLGGLPLGARVDSHRPRQYQAPAPLKILILAVQDSLVPSKSNTRRRVATR